MRRKLTFGFIIAAGAIAAILWGVTQKAYPVATVNDAFISARLFQIAETAARSYYEKIGAVSGALASTTGAEFNGRMRQIALQALIEDELVAAKLRTLYEAEPLESAIVQRVNLALASSSQETSKAINELFSLSVDEFSEIVLAPQARIELLQAELMKSEIDFESWLKSALIDARVSISVNDLKWANGYVELTGEQSYTARVKEIFDQIASTTEALQNASTTTEQ
ncbi:MAG: hypothetical protein Q7R62_01030 [bacterium]|nr:hypothetical protein [bacterium]